MNAREPGLGRLKQRTGGGGDWSGATKVLQDYPPTYPLPPPLHFPPLPRRRLLLRCTVRNFWRHGRPGELVVEGSDYSQHRGASPQLWPTRRRKVRVMIDADAADLCYREEI